MKMHFNIISIVLILISSNGLLQKTEAKNKYNVTMNQLLTCKEFDIRGTGYTYRDFFVIHFMDNNKVAVDEQLHLKFYVMTNMDAHILLSANDRPRLIDRVYEIVIGAGGNTFSTIRTSMGRRRVATNQDAHILSPIDAVPIEIIQKRDGNLLIYIPGFKDDPLLNYTDSNPLSVNYVSFSSFGSTSARWFYDCPFDGFDKEMEIEERSVLPIDRLIANLTEKAGNKTMPSNLTTVDLSFSLSAITYNQNSAILHSRMNLELVWNHPELMWDPENFDGLNTVVKPDFDIWIPSIVLLNGALKSFQGFHPNHEMRIDSNGTVILKASNVEISTWCPNIVRNFPHDVLQCEFTFGSEDFSALDAGDETQSLELKINMELPNPEVMSLSEWKCTEINLTNVVDPYILADVVRAMPGAVSISIAIARNSMFYKNVFIMPLLACQILIILSFFLRGYRRGAIIAVVCMVLMMGIMYITRLALPSYVPDIMAAYQHILRITTFCYMLHVSLLWLELYPPKDKPNNVIMSVINFSWLRFLLCMRFNDSTEYVEIQEKPWGEIAKMLNNLSFIVINIFMIFVNVVLLPM